MSQPIRDQLQKTLGSAYTLERELGGGGMSRVFVAEETALRRKVVVKVLPPELTAGVNVERFNREILLAARLQHPHIVPVLSAGETEGLPYYTMPLVEGESLRARLAKGPLGLTEAVSILKDVARALAYAHERGIVHRDIKPDNVLLTGGSATVTDFGIAKAISASRTQGGNETLTSVGTSIGTPTYMSPEQAAGDPDTDHRADIYSWACMAYELLAGRPPFVETQPRKLLAAHMGEKPKPVTDIRADSPPALADLIMRSLAKESSDRPQQASDLVRVLETVTSSGTGQALPSVLLGGPGMFKKALAIYAGAFVVVAVLAKAAIVGIGLPDWVFPGSLIVMALGLPVVLWTGYVQRVARRAMTATPTYTPGGTAAIQQGTIATMALKAAPRMSWYRTARGGMYALGAFVALIAMAMTMRWLNIGPFATLAGAIKADDRVLLTDFTVSGGDSTIGRVVSDAVRSGLGQSRAFTIVTPADLAPALQRMQKAANSMLDFGTARDLARREGIKAIVDGNVANVAGSYVVAIRLVTADSGRELSSHRATAAGPDKLIEAADDVARQLRSKAGESLRRVQNSAPLAQMTTASFEALRKYSEGARANDIETDYLKAVGLLRQAVAADSMFAEGWRKLGVAMSNQGFPRSQSDSAITRAYLLRNRLPDRERDLIVAYYFNSGPGHDRAKAAEAYESLVARGESIGITNNLANIYRDRREFARAESLYRTRLPSGSQLAYTNLIFTLQLQGKMREADSLNTVARKAFPDNPFYSQFGIGWQRDRGDLDAYRRSLDSARRVVDKRDPAYASWALMTLSADLGQLENQRNYRREAIRLDSTIGRKARPLDNATSDVFRRVNAGLPAAEAVRGVDEELRRRPLESLPVSERPYFGVATAYALSGQPEKAKVVLNQYHAAIKDSLTRRDQSPALHGALSAIAFAERRWGDAVVEARAGDRLPDGPAHLCEQCLPKSLAWIFSNAGMHDSVLVQYAEYKKTPMGSRPLEGPDTDLGADLLERVARAYDAKGDAANAAALYRQFIELWKHADPELQPRVAAAKKRLAELSPVEGKKP